MNKQQKRLYALYLSGIITEEHFYQETDEMMSSDINIEDTADPKTIKYRRMKDSKYDREIKRRFDSIHMPDLDSVYEQAEDPVAKREIEKLLQRLRSIGFYQTILLQNGNYEPFPSHVKMMAFEDVTKKYKTDLMKKYNLPDLFGVRY